MALWSQLVILKDHASDPGADAFGDHDISNKTNVIEYFDGSPLSCKLTLDARRGRFMTKGPIIKKWDRIYVQVTDKFGEIKHSVFHVKTIKKKRKKGKGTQLELFCPHQSSNRLTVKVSIPNLRTSGHEALIAAFEQVNDPENKGSKDPNILIQSTFVNSLKLGSRLDPTLANNYVLEFVPLQKAIDMILEKEGNVVAGGGSFQFFYFRFISLYDHASHTGIDTIGFQVFEQGFKQNGSNFNNTPTVTLKKPTLVSKVRGNIQEMESNEESELGTNLVAVADKGSGSYPVETAIFQGEKDNFFLVQEWAVGRLYKIDQRVKHIGIYYRCTAEHTSTNGNKPPGLLQWSTPLTFTPSVDYSPLTKTKAQYWINSLAGAKYSGADDGINHTCFIDFNCIIKDPKHNRVYVDCVENDSLKVILKTNLMKNGLPYDGFKVLVTNPSTGTSSGLAGDFTGQDKNGVGYSNNIAEFQNPSHVLGEGEYVVIRVTETDDEVVDWEECKAWTYDRCSGILATGTPKDVCTLGSRNGIWKKGAYGFSNGLLGTGIGAVFRDDALFDCFHLVKRNGSGVVEVGNEKINADDVAGNSAVFINFDPSDDERSAIAGFNFDMLFPHTNNGIPFGTVNIGEKMNLETFDMTNMDRNHLGTRTWFGENVIDYFPIQGFKFWQNLQDFTIGGLLNFLTPGNYNMGLFLIDRFYNKVLIRYVHGANNVTVPQDAPLGKAKTQVSVQGVTGFIQTNDPENNVIFDFRNVVKGGIVTMDSFDAQGKYISGVNSIISLGQSNNRFFNSDKIHLAIDAFRMIKPLVATNIRDSSKPTRNIMPQILKQETIISQNQIQDYVDAQEKIFNFEASNFKLDRAGKNNLQFGDPVYLNDTDAINETTNGLPNTILAVVDSEVLVCSKPTKGPGGFTSSVNIKTRLFP